MSIITNVKILYISRLVLHFELLRNTKIIRVQNEYVDIFTGFLKFFIGFKLHFKVNQKTHNKKRQIKYQLDIISYGCVTHVEINRTLLHGKTCTGKIK